MSATDEERKVCKSDSEKLTPPDKFNFANLPHIKYMESLTDEVEVEPVHVPEVVTTSSDLDSSSSSSSSSESESITSEISGVNIYVGENNSIIAQILASSDDSDSNDEWMVIDEDYIFNAPLSE